MHNEVAKQKNKLDDTNFDLNNTKNMLKTREESLIFSQKQVEDGNKNIVILQVNIDYWLYK